MTETLPPITRPNGKLYRPRSLRVVGWDDHSTYPESWQVAVLGTHDIARAREEARHGYHCPHLINPETGWVRLGMRRGDPHWVYDEVRGAACVIFDESDDPPEEPTHGIPGCRCRHCLACTGSCRRCGQRDPAKGEELCGQCEVELAAEINSGGGS